MTSLPALLVAGFLAIFGIVLIIDGTRPRDRGTTPAGPGLAARGRAWWARLPRRWKVSTAIAIVAGLVAFALTGWLVTLVAVPAAVLGLPWLLSTPHNHELARLQAIDQWVRLLAGSILTGKSVADAMRATRRQAPPELAAAVHLAVSRLDGRWSVADALRAMADELDSADVDAVLAALILASERGGTGASETLLALAESTQDRLRSLREIEAERAKPRIVVRQVTVITLVVLGLALVVGRGFFAPYGTPWGQAILAVLLTAYVGSLVVLRHRTLPRRRQRILAGSPA